MRSLALVCCSPGSPAPSLPDGLAPGGSASRGHGNACGALLSAFVDTAFEVAETDEASNARTENFVCGRPSGRPALIVELNSKGTDPCM